MRKSEVDKQERMYAVAPVMLSKQVTVEVYNSLWTKLTRTGY